MAGVIAHRKAIVSSANARVRVILISVPRFADTINTKVLLPTEILDHVPLICSDPRELPVKFVRAFSATFRADLLAAPVQYFSS
jgi:hypothetical protein